MKMTRENEKRIENFAEKERGTLIDTIQELRR